MKVCEGCKLFGAYEALAGIRGGVVLLHSVTGCNFGTLTMEIENRMNRVNQCCTVINENDVIFGGETSVEAALRSVWELYHPQVIFLISGCISSMVGDDVQSCVRQVNLPCPVICISAPGFAGGMQNGYEEAANALFSLMEKTKKKENDQKARGQREDGITVNLLGLGSGDVRLWQDLLALQNVFDGQVRILMNLSDCEVEQIKNASLADCNFAFGRGIGLAKKMEEAFGIPYVELDYPYGITGEEAVYQAVEQSCGVKLHRGKHREKAVEQLKRIYAYLQALYGSSAAVIGSRARANGDAAIFGERTWNGRCVFCDSRRIGGSGRIL